MKVAHRQLRSMIHGPNSAIRNTCGFSLIETITAVVIFSVAIVALIEGIAGSTRTQAWIESQSRAMMLAQNIMEELQYSSDMRVGVDGGQFPDDTRFSWTTEITETEYEELYEVHVSVIWTEGTAERDYRLVTYLRARNDELMEEEPY